MTLSKLPSPRLMVRDRESIHHTPTHPPTLSRLAAQIRAIADRVQQNSATIDQMGQQIHFLETRMEALESTTVQQAVKPSYSTIPTAPQPTVSQPMSQSMNNLNPRKVPFLPKLASRLIKLYFIAILGLGLFLWLHIILSLAVDTNFIEAVWAVFWRAGLALLLFLGVVSVQQSVR
jgi:hypothetical protein